MISSLCFASPTPIPQLLGATYLLFLKEASKISVAFFFEFGKKNSLFTIFIFNCRGCFIFNRESESSINILAHLSNKACEKASVAANSLPVKLDVKLMAKNDVWPRSFVRLPPTDCSIALYLFPELEG